MREWRTDQAGLSPYTLDAGHFEAEITAVSYGSLEENFDAMWGQPGSLQFQHDHDKTEHLSYGEMTLKAGLLNCLDAEVVLRPYTVTTYSGTSAYWGAYKDYNGAPYSYSGSTSYRYTESRFGDVTSRLKLNVWGNDGGVTALSISGDVNFPTSNPQYGFGNITGGPGLEFAANLPYGIELRVNSSANFYYSFDYPNELFFENQLSLGHRIFGPLYGYCLLDTRLYRDPDPNWMVPSGCQAQIVPGLNYRLNQHFDIFVRSGFSIEGHTEAGFYDYSPSMGVNIRL